MRVLQIIAPARVGGLETMVFELTKVQHGSGVVVAMILLVVKSSRKERNRIELTEVDGVNHFEIHTNRRNYVEQLNLMLSVIRKFKPQVLHTHGYHSDVLGFVASRFTKIPIVTTVHGTSCWTGQARWYAKLQRYVQKRFSAVVAVSRPLSDELLLCGVRSDILFTVLNKKIRTNSMLLGSEARNRFGVVNDIPVIGWVGRLVPVKNIGRFIEALSQVANPEWCAVIIGDGPQMASARDLVAKYCLGSRVTFTGEIDGAGRYFRGFDIFALTSDSEGSPMVLLEAFAAGNRIVATNVGGVRDLVESENGGATLTDCDATDIATAIGDELRQLAATPRSYDRSAVSDSQSMLVGKAWGDAYIDIYNYVCRP